MPLSDAVTLDRVSRVVGYKITKGFFNTVSPNLPQRIVVLAEANDANQASLSTTPIELTTSQQVGNLFGFGSPAHLISRILRPVLGGDGVGAIPTQYMVQPRAANATPKILTITPVGVATQNVTHYLRVAGRRTLDGVDYAINIVVGDTAATISQKIANAINAAIGAPCLANNATYSAILTTKWSGATANDFNVTVDTGTPAVSGGITYSIVTSQTAIATPSIASALAAFQNDWNTIVINSYGLNTSIMSTLETFNGRPDPANPTGRYAGIVLRPFVAISGSILDDPSAITDFRQDDVTIAVAPAPNSPGFAFEAAANMAYVWAIKAQNNPQLDVNADFYPDMPTPVLASSFGTMNDYNNRDAIVKKGCSTVTLENGRYKVEDFVTTYHPSGENPPQYRYVRNLNIDWNVKYGYYLLQDINVRDKVLASDGDNVSVANVIKPKTWKAILDGYADDLASRALITQPSFMQDSITVKLGETNPDRLEVFFRYKRSGVARIVSTTAQAGFNFGAI